MVIKNMKVLAIDDNHDNLISLKALIKEAFPEALTLMALDGDAGLQLAASEDPDVILLDIVMPGQDGFEVCKRLKSDPALKEIPVIFFTATRDDKEHHLRALEVGAEGFLSKPIDISDLTAQIRAMVKIKNANIEKLFEKKRLAELVEERTYDLKKAHLASLNMLEDLKSENESRKKSEIALKISEKRFRTLIENAFDGIYLTNGQFFYYVNEKFCEILGYSAEELTSPDFNFDVTLTEDSRKLVRERSQLRELQKEVPGTYEFKMKSKDGKYKNVEVSTVNLAIGDELNVMGIVRDVSERKKIESQMIHAERLTALGEMSAGIAHEINQPLTTLSLAFDNILYDVNENEEFDKSYLLAKVNKIFENIDRIRNIIDHIRAFSRNQDSFVLTAFNVNDGIRSALSMITVQYEIIGINVSAVLDEKLPLIIGNVFKMEQVVLNMVSNAKDALIEKKNRLQENYPMAINIRTFIREKQIVIELEDNGIGIKSSDIEKVLLPFYTTKETGKGTGLGLSISYGFIKELKGDIEISSEVLIGTTITIFLPLSEQNYHA
jgi:PAS domain S-box-containing protein